MHDEIIIVIEDNETMRMGIADSLTRSGYQVRAFAEASEAIAFCRTASVGAAVIDLKMEPINGIEALRQIKEIVPKLEAILISAYGTVEDAVAAMQLGASDFLTKPFSPEELRFRIHKIFKNLEEQKHLELLKEQNTLLHEEVLGGNNGISGTSDAMKQVQQLIAQVAPTESTVLITGESGTGKERAALAIHKQSNRSAMPFIKVNCAALHDNLLESELFGHEKGAFTGAIKLKRGRFELAEKGTLFLDEIGDISSAMQLKLLRVLQEREFERVGGEKTISCDVRIIAATNKNIPKLIKDGQFREDLYYRLHVIPIFLPPLRERSGDVSHLTAYFLNKLIAKNHIEKKIEDEGIRLLSMYHWPGNIRELENLIERLYVITPGTTIEAEVIQRHLFSDASPVTAMQNLPLEEAVQEYEKLLIKNALEKSGGVKNRAAKILGVSPSNLFYKLEKHGLL